MPEASLRWMFHHSLLRGDVGDGIIIGASSVGQLEQNLSAFTRGDLPADIVKAFDDAWTVFKPDCVKYFRP